MVNNVYDLVTRTMEQEFPGRVAFRWVEDATGTVKEKTYAEYAQDIRRAAAWFARNIPEVEGKRVVLLSRNCYEYGVNTFGAVLAGAVLVTMNQKKTWDELSWELELAEPGIKLNLRQQVFTDKHHVQHAGDGYRNTDPGKFEEAKARQAGSSQSAGCNDVRRGTYHGDDTAPAAGKCQRH